MIFETQEQLDAALAIWQKRLRLQDWHIKASLKSGDDLDSSGRVVIHLRRKEVYIRLLSEPYHKGTHWDPIPCDMEHVLVHELVHVHMEAFAPKESECSAKYDAFESAVDTLAKSLVDGYRAQVTA